ncbi:MULTISPECIES: preprotein translocase subunit YajC [unclassified Sphingomonas]|uniref:preprotein translocase subunit YajC n=1 Tax=unclassified Sphingomonas TaxID=196159 RepID=UPI0006FA3EB8|nr:MULTISPECIES: preprotein translocase subunit YajC [unclassified Sphingomonas]KQX26273.1 preprotein translocase subunit YajC [Sphingomonas sp. Root1294]KQY69342.1 preprotein translocase subunit YajC [Sphingomonas sp. Root50]KRB89601.1 preprotein translocase subunit YajC [Sphingomonas sp. Root720]
MFASPAYAQAAGAAGSSSGSTIFMLGQFVLIGVIFYFLLIRPQQKRAKEHRATIDAVKKNDLIVTAGGIVAKVVKVDEHEVEAEIAPNVKVKIVKGTIAEVRTAGAGKPAND